MIRQRVAAVATMVLVAGSISLAVPAQASEFSESTSLTDLNTAAGLSSNRSLGASVSEPSGTLTIPAGKSFVLDLNGFNLDLKQVYIDTTGSLTITDATTSPGLLTVDNTSGSDASIHATLATVTITGNAHVNTSAGHSVLASAAK